MTVILAVEPDPRQASRLSSVLRGRRNTEVVIARSADTAIESIAGRVPNVLLTSPLLSPQDETRLADWLRELGPSASHVQALTIPILAPKVAKEPPQRGLLTSLRRRTPNPGPHGCEPKMFAEHVAAYLGQEPFDTVHEVRGRVIPEPMSADSVRPEPMMVEAAPEPVMLEPARVEPVVVATVRVEPVLVESATEPVIVEPTPVAACPATDEDEGLWLLTRSPQVIEFADEPPRENIDTLVPGLVSLLSSPQELNFPRHVKPVAPFEVIFEPPQVITVRDDACEPMSRGKTKPAPPAGPVDADTDTDFGAPPVEDEWGLFDASKCGFSALLDKLDEAADDKRPSTTKVESSVRIVTHY